MKISQTLTLKITILHIFTKGVPDIQVYFPTKFDFQQTTHFSPACIVYFLHSALGGTDEFFFMILCTGKHYENMRTLPCLVAAD